MINEEVNEILREMEDTEAISEIRDDIVVSKLLKAYKKSRSAKLDTEGIFEEVEDMMDTIQFTPNSLNLDGAQGLKESKDLRIRIISVRDRLMSIGNKLALSEAMATRVFNKTTSYILTSDVGETLRKQKLSVRQADAVVHAALEEVTHIMDDVSFLKGRVSSALTECNEKTRALDSWVNIHKQYMFFNNRGPDDNQDDEAPPRFRSKKTRRL